MKVYLRLAFSYKSDDCLDSFVQGVVEAENGEILAKHTSSTISWLRADLQRYLPENHNYEIIDLLGSEDGKHR